ncbi:MAG: twin-arginine translocation signal domain-containing protein, partial [Planctomycetota bacterium]
MSESINRRHFIGNTAAATAAVGLGLSSLKALADSSPNNKVVVGVMGLSRGSALATGFASLPNVEVKYLCDIDKDRIPALTGQIKEISGKAPEGITDFRRILDDKSV